jgi:O-antigen/teichoic acid export membrane protein
VLLVAFRLSGLRPSFPPLDLQHVRSVIAGGLPFLGCTLTQIVASTIDRVILGAMVPAAEVGWYAAANRIVYIPIFVPNLVSAPLFVAVSRHSGDTPMVRKALAESLRVVLLCTVPLAAGLMVVAPVIPSLVGWPADFENTVVLMQVLAISMPLMSVNTILVSALMALGRERRWVWLSAVVTVANILMNIACIPLFESLTGDGAIGSAAITAVTEVLMTAGILTLVPREVLDSRTLWVGTRITLAGVVAGLAANATLPQAIVLSAVVGAVTYFGCTFLLKVLTTADVRHILARRFA